MDNNINNTDSILYNTLKESFEEWIISNDYGDFEDGNYDLRKEFFEYIFTDKIVNSKEFKALDEMIKNINFETEWTDHLFWEKENEEIRKMEDYLRRNPE